MADQSDDVPDRGADQDGAPGRADTRTVTYCVVPADLAAELHDLLRGHFRDDPAIEVIVERRSGERRRSNDRRHPAGTPPQGVERRRVTGVAGRRIADRRAAVVALPAPLALPRRARRHAERLTFLERVEPAEEHLEDLDTARLVVRFQSGERDAFNTIYSRYFERVYAFLRILLRDHHETEDTTQEVFTKVFEALPRYERRSQPFRAWVFAIARNSAVDRIRAKSRTEPMEPERLELEAATQTEPEPQPELQSLGWISDRELLLFVERLPLAQRRVLALRYMLGLTSRETAQVLGRSYSDVRVLQSRALRYLEARLAAVGRRSAARRDRAGVRRRFRQAPVLRLRRFALGYGPAPRQR